MSATTATIETPTGRVLKVEITDDQFGRSTYATSLVKRTGEVLPMGSVVIHPDHRTDPKPGRVYVQFGEGDLNDRHARTNVPTIGGDGPYLVGGAILNPNKITDEDGQWFRSRVASHPTHSHSHSAGEETGERAGDIVGALVKHWLARPEHTALTTAYSKFRAPEVKAALHAKLAILRANITALELTASDYESKIAFLDLVHQDETGTDSEAETGTE
ncbi:hypothetical protein [Kitasatospora sp. MBT63]|uniref:hypothetical protein n=1 Tax=Kitasatospora sp. MBT63 TaxID=1444768 RepID=UPI000539B5D5|nr:hypothetical protein [Kitasatospora sp. MBT63]